MALLAKQFSLILFIALSLSFHVHARDSQFFSKVTANNNENTKEVKVETPNQEEPLKAQDNEPNFVQDPKNGYGLWGHESGQNPPTVAKTTAGGVAGKVHPPSTTNNNEAYVADPQGVNEENEYRKTYNNNAYVASQQGMGNTRFAEKTYTTGYTTDSNNNNGAYVADPQGVSEENEYRKTYNNNAYVASQQGMGNTRFAEKTYTTGNNNNNNNNNGAYVADPQSSSDNYNTDAYVTTGRSNNNNNYYNNGAYVADPEPKKYPSNYNNVAYVTPIGGSNNNNNYYDSGAYVADQHGSSGTSFEEKEEYTTNNNKNYYNNGNPQGMSNNNNYHYNGANNYNTQKQGMSDTRFMENGKYYYDPKVESNYPNTYKYNSNDNNDDGVKKYTTQQYGSSGTSLVGNSFNPQKQGMSDTRFLENGKYYYDLESENNYGHGYGNTRGVKYNNQGYNGNSFEENNSMGGYENEEFEENQEERYMP